jgi:Polysaccharide lyase
MTTAKRKVARAAIRTAAVFMIAGPSGCNSHVDLGVIGDSGENVLWSATFEPGDLSEWSGDGQGGSYLENGTIPAVAATDVAHKGRFAGKCAVTPALGLASVSYVFRRQPSRPEAYYSAWFYLSPALTVGSWLSLVHFNGSHTGDGRNVYPTWDVNLYPQPSGALVAHLYNFVTQTNVESASPLPVPTGRWVHFEVLMRKATQATGRVAVWQDDVLILEADAVVSTENDWMEWDAGAASNDVTPSPGVVYVDDAAISLRRLGGS